MKKPVRYCYFVALIAFTIWTLFVLYKRIFYGADLTDESYYSAQAVAFARGFRPYLDESMVHQSFAVLLQPIVRLFLNLNGGTDGIVLLFRKIYYFSLLGVCILGWRIARRHYASDVSLLASLLLFSFWPFILPSLSYNTMGSMFFNLGLLFLLNQSDAKRSSWLLPLSILMFGLASYSYPTGIISVLITGLLFYRSSKDISFNRIHVFAASLVAIVLFLTAVYIITVHIGIERVRAILHYTGSHNLQAGGFSKIKKIFDQVLTDLPFILAFCGSLWAASYLLKRKIFLGFILLIIPIWGLFRYPLGASMAIPPFHALITYCCLATVPVYFLKGKRGNTTFWQQIPMVSLVAGGICSWTSGNGYANFAVGSSIGILFFGEYVQKLVQGYRPYIRPIAVGFLIMLVLSLVKTQYQSVYGDDSNFANMNQELDFGPYKGLKTTIEKKEYLRTLAQDIEKYQGTSRSVAFLESFMYGYLFTNLQIKSPAVWVYSLSEFKYDRQIVANYFENRDNQPDLIFWQNNILVDHSFSYHLKNDFPDPLKAVVQKTYEIVQERENYIIYKKAAL